MTNIAMENPKHNWSFLGKSSIFMGHLYHGYVTNNQRVKKIPRFGCSPRILPIPSQAYHGVPTILVPPKLQMKGRTFRRASPASWDPTCHG